MLSYRRRIAIMATADRGGPFVERKRARTQLDEGGGAGDRIQVRAAARVFPDRRRQRQKAIQLSSPAAWNLYHIARDRRHRELRRRRLHAREGAARAMADARGVGPRPGETGAPVKPWPWADTHPVARLIAPAQDADVLVLAGASGRTLAFGPGHLRRLRAARRCRQCGHHRASRHALPLPACDQPGRRARGRARRRRHASLPDTRRVRHRLSRPAPSARHGGADPHAGDVLSLRRPQPRRAAPLRRRRGSRVGIRRV